MEKVKVKKVIKLTKSGSVTIPAEIRKLIGIEPGNSFQIDIDAVTGDIILKRVAGRCAISGRTSGLFNYGGKLISIDTLLDMVDLYENGIKDSAQEYLEKDLTDKEMSEEFKKHFTLEDGFKHSAMFRNNKVLKMLEEKNEDIERKRIAKENSDKAMKELKKKEKKAKEAKQMSFEDFLKLPVEERLRPDELEVFDSKPKKTKKAKDPKTTASKTKK